jgi:hypothetical protein
MICLRFSNVRMYDIFSLLFKHIPRTPAGVASAQQSSLSVRVVISSRKSYSTSYTTISVLITTRLLIFLKKDTFNCISSTFVRITYIKYSSNMASGLGLKGNVSRCYYIFEDFSKCMVSYIL